MIVIIPHYNTHPSRERNLKFILSWWKEVRPNDRIIVIEQNMSVNLSDFGVEHINFPMTGSFCKTQCFNAAFKHCDMGLEEIVAFVDNDCVLGKDDMNSLEEEMGDSEYFIPYDWCNDLNENETVQLFNNRNPDSFKGTPRGRQNVGGMNLFIAKSFIEVGGYDPFFRGWGCEDDAMYTKSHRLLKYKRGSFVMKHINHNILYNKGGNPEYYPNRNKLTQINNFNPEQLKDYVNSLGKEHICG